MPTIKQKKAFKELGVNGGNISQAMKVAGYSESVSGRTDKLVRTKGWEELMEQYLPDKLLGQKHKALLNKKDKETGEPETQAVSKGLEMAYKLKGRFVERIDHTTLGKELPTPMYGGKATV